MYILGIHFGSHDTSAALVEDGKLVAVMEQERFDHIKHTRAFPKDAIQFCLDFAGISLKDLAYVACANDPEFTNIQKEAFKKDAASKFSPTPSSQSALEQTVRNELKESVPLFFVNHHLAHAASSFYLSPFERAAIFTIDGMGNWVTTTGGIGHGNRIETTLQIAHPHSLGLFYGAVTQYLGFKAASDECKVMGLASYGNPTYLDAFREICTPKKNSLGLDLDYFTFHEKPLMRPDGSFNLWYSDVFSERFGPPREPESTLTEHARDIAHSIQALLEERCYELLRDLHRETKCDDLCIAGGVALNSSMNGQILTHTPFKRTFIVPAANDAGLSIGAALLCAAEHAPNFKRAPLVHAYYGSSHPDEEIAAEIEKLPNTIRCTKPENFISATAQLLADHQIVGWYQGRMEFGPRALGNRSILANPTRGEMKDIINQKVKFRENFRPFAPMIPLEYVSDYFSPGFETPFMLNVVDVVPEKRSVIPAVTHVDNTARVQTVTPAQNQKIYELLHEMKRLNGVPVLLNTSFNIRGDTIVRTPADAMKCFMTTGMNALAIGPYLLIKES